MKEHASSCCGTIAACSTSLHHTRGLRRLQFVLLLLAACLVWSPRSRRGRSRIFGVSMSNLLILALKSLKVFFRVIIELVEVVLKNLWDSKLYHGERRGEDVWIRVKNLLICRSPLKLPNSLKPSLFPFLDESFLAILNNIISFLQKQRREQVPSVDDLLKILEELKAVKDVFEQISQSAKAIKSEESTDEVEREELKPESAQQYLRNSLEMLQNGGKFTKPIEKRQSMKKSSNSSRESTKRSSNESNSLPKSVSRTSLRNSMTVSPCAFIRRPAPFDHKKLVSRISKAAQKKAKEEKQSVSPPPMGSPNIVSTNYATCRIHSYDDNSTTFEIINPRRTNCSGDEIAKPEAVIVVLPSGQTALFKSKSSASFINSLPFAESQ